MFNVSAREFRVNSYDPTTGAMAWQVKVTGPTGAWCVFEFLSEGDNPTAHHTGCTAWFPPPN